MKLSDYKNDFYEFSAKASEVARKASFAGIAVVWVFKVSTGSTPQIPLGLLGPTICFVLALGFDLIHYIAGSAIWGLFHAHHERKLTDVQDDPEVSHSSWLELPINGLFVMKLIAVLTGYVWLSLYLFTVWF